jgi:hypothetical protein
LIAATIFVSASFAARLAPAVSGTVSRTTAAIVAITVRLRGTVTPSLTAYGVS